MLLVAMVGDVWCAHMLKTGSSTRSRKKLMFYAIGKHGPGPRAGRNNSFSGDRGRNKPQGISEVLHGRRLKHHSSLREANFSHRLHFSCSPKDHPQAWLFRPGE